jgi:hypothetical protein
MIIAGPRSGTTWAANWLCTNYSHCIHDPIASMMPDDLDSIPSGGKMLGVSCTGLGLFTDFLNNHPARKVILHRSSREIDKSLGRLGVTPPDIDWDRMLYSVQGVHVPWTALFDKPREIYEFLLQRPFEKTRHEELCRMKIEPNFNKLSYSESTLSRLMERLKGGT